MIITTSTASTPICNPQLPPEIGRNAGALQPFAVRQVATPLPPFAPKTKPPLTMCGTTAMHLACPNTSSGIPLSGIPTISCITSVALSSRSVASSRPDAAQPSVPRLNIASTNVTFFIGQPHFCYLICADSGFVLSEYTRTQIRLYMQAHRVASDASKSEFKDLSKNAHMMYLCRLQSALCMASSRWDEHLLVEIITVPSFALRQNSRSVNSEIGLALTSIPANCEIAGNESSRKDRAASGGAREDLSQYPRLLHGASTLRSGCPSVLR